MDFFKRGNKDENKNEACQFKPKTVFEAEDGSRVLVSKDPKTGKFIVNVAGSNIGVKCYGKLYVKGDITTDISVKGDIEVEGNIDACHVVATGNVHCNVESNGAKVERYAIKDDYDIEVNAGLMTFNGSICKMSRLGNSFGTGNKVSISDDSKVKLNITTFIITSDDTALENNGELIVSGEKRLLATSLSGSGVGIYCGSENSGKASLYIYPKATVECSGTRRCFDNGSNSNVFVHGRFIADGKKYGLVNRGTFRVCSDSSNVDCIGETYGIYNWYTKSNFIIESDATVYSVGDWGGGFHNHFGKLFIQEKGCLISNGGLSYVIENGLGLYDPKWANVDGSLSINRPDGNDKQILRGDCEVMYGKNSMGVFDTDSPFVGSGRVRYNSEIIMEGNKHESE